MTKIIDAHSHCLPGAVAEHTTFFKFGWSDADKQLQMMDAQHIEQAVLLYPTSDAHLLMGGWDKLCAAYNGGIAKIIDQHRDRFIGAGIIPAAKPALIKNELSRIEQLGFKVLSLASSYDGIYLDDERFFSVYDFAQRKDMLVHVHPQIINPIGEERVKDPLLSPVLEYVFDVSVCIGKLMMSGTFLQFPKVKFIFAHYGGVLPIVKERFDNTYKMLRKRELVKDLKKLPGEYFANLYFDTSGSRSAASLLSALELTDASHILFGSDYPANQDLPGSIDLIRHGAWGEEKGRLILESNCLALL